MGGEGRAVDVQGTCANVAVYDTCALEYKPEQREASMGLEEEEVRIFGLIADDRPANPQ